MEAFKRCTGERVSFFPFCLPIIPSLVNILSDIVSQHAFEMGMQKFVSFCIRCRMELANLSTFRGLLIVCLLILNDKREIFTSFVFHHILFNPLNDQTNFLLKKIQPFFFSFYSSEDRSGYLRFTIYTIFIRSKKNFPFFRHEFFSVTISSSLLSRPLSSLFPK